MSQIPPDTMTDNDLVDEFMEMFRMGRNLGTYDRPRMRAVCAEISKRQLLDLKRLRESLSEAT